MFVEEELFEGNNLYRCAQCDRLVTAAKVSVRLLTVLALSQNKGIYYFYVLHLCSTID